MTLQSIIAKADQLREKMQKDRRKAIERHNNALRTGLIRDDEADNVLTPSFIIASVTFIVALTLYIIFLMR